MRLNDCDAVVVGAGIGGAATALLLAAAGASVTVLERVATPGDVGAGLLLQPNGLAVLDGLGLAGPLAARGNYVSAPTLRSAAGTVLADLRPPAYGAGLDRLLAVHRADLHALLLTALHEQPRIAVHTGASVTAARPDGTVTVRWHGRDDTFPADLVVGADGIHSVVRSGGGFGGRLIDRHYRYLRATVDGPPVALHGEYWTRLGLFGGAPVTLAATYFYADATAAPVVAALQARNLTALRDVWAHTLPVAGVLLDRVASFDDLILTGVSDVHCRRWHDGRLVLVGDAAHAMAPTVGQGANSALVDAAVLVHELVAADTEPLDEALRRYTTRRLHRVAVVQRRAGALARLSRIRGRLAQRVRDAVLAGLAGRAGGTAASRIQQEDPVALRGQVLRITDG